MCSVSRSSAFTGITITTCSKQRAASATPSCGANLHLLFWLSLIPVATKWVGKAHQARLPASVYGIASVGAAVAYALLVQMIIRANGRESPVATAIGSDIKGRLSFCLFAVGAGLAWLSPWIAYALYVAVAIAWFVPDRRLRPQAQR